MILTKNGIKPTPDNFNAMEAGLLAQTGGKLAVWSGRAATAFYHAYKLALRRRPDIKAPEVIMPAMSCTTAANVAAMMGIKPRFADLDIMTGLVTLETIEPRLTANTIAVVAIHLFGNPIEMDAIQTWCKEKNLFLIEDPTQALSGKYPNGDYLGSKGDVALYSFNKTKIIEVGNGILIANGDETAADLEKLLAEEETPFPNISEDERSRLALKYRDMHHALVSVLRPNPAHALVVSQSFLEKRHEFESLYLKPVNPEVDMNAAWEGLEESLKHRFKLANAYASIFYNFDPRIPNIGRGIAMLRGFKVSGVAWRVSLMNYALKDLVTMCEGIRKDGFHVSNLYWPVNHFFRPTDRCPNADDLASRIFNVWVDKTVDEDYVKRCCQSIFLHAM